MKVREFLTKENWGKAGSDACLPPVGKSCLMMAAAHCYKEDRDGYNRAWAKLRVELHDSPIIWNDAPERTFEQVKELVDRLDI